MTPLLEQFLSEAREVLQGISEKLMQLESEPNSRDTINELFRLVHTLKGNSGLFEFPEMTRVLHAGEDLMDAVRDGRVGYSQLLADRLLDAMDFVNLLLDEIEFNGGIGTNHVQDALRLTELLRQLLGTATANTKVSSNLDATENLTTENLIALRQPYKKLPNMTSLLALPEETRMALYAQTLSGSALLMVEYTPEPECFFKGEDPFFQAQQIPETIWQSIQTLKPWPAMAELDAYLCNVQFQALSTANADDLYELFRYTPEQVSINPVAAIIMALPQGEPNGGPVYGDFVLDALALLEAGEISKLTNVSNTMLELHSPNLWLSSALRWLLLVLKLEPDNHKAQRLLIESLNNLAAPDWASFLENLADGLEIEPVAVLIAAKETATAITVNTTIAIASKVQHEDAFALNFILQAQRQILNLPDSDNWLVGRLNSVANTLNAIHINAGRNDVLPALNDALEQALIANKAEPLLAWLDDYAMPSNTLAPAPADAVLAQTALTQDALNQLTLTQSVTPLNTNVSDSNNADLNIDIDADTKFGRRTEDTYSAPKTLKVDQVKIDILMNLIGEMVVAKNSLPYLAGLAETQYGVRELGREIKSQYAVINRIAEEMQDAIMQVRMMPVSFIFQRFPRLVRDTSRKLGKIVNLILEGENTEADKNIVEALADPLIHIIRNSLDHGLESPEVRRAAGKPEAGKLTIRASQESNRVYIEISDDGKGINPEVVKRKAYEKGIIDEAALERMTDQEAVNLVFAAGFSTTEIISDLSGRGVGMDVVRSAVEKVNGTVSIESEVGKGTLIRLSLPLSMAITNVMIVESADQAFGVPMGMVVETVRVPRDTIRTIKNHKTMVLRGRIIPLLSLNDLLAVEAPQLANENEELAMLVVHINNEFIGILVDEFRETVDIILKPMNGIIAGLGGYSGSALLGDGSVLMVLNLKELF